MKTTKSTLTIGKAEYIKMDKTSKMFSIFENEKHKTRMFIFDMKDKLERYIFNSISMRKTVRFTHAEMFGSKLWMCVIVNTKNYKKIIKNIKDWIDAYEKTFTKIEPQD